MNGPDRGLLDLAEERRDGVLVLRPAGRIEGARLKEFREQFTRRVDGGDNLLVVDCAAVEHVAPAGFRALLDLARRLDSRGGSLELHGLRGRLRAAAASLSGPAGPLDIRDGAAEAPGEAAAEAGEPPPFERVNPGGAFPVLLVCDHAGAAVPRSLGGLGISGPDLRRHIGWDIGARDVTVALAGLLDAPAVLARYSRLVIDPNRGLDQPDSIPEVSDGTPVPGNAGLSEEERRRRAERYFHPYHDAVREALDAMPSGARALVSVHTFTPALRGGEPRPWEIGILWEGREGRFAKRVLAALRAEEGLAVGENVPYAPEIGVGYTTGEHGNRRGIPNLMVEIRQDLVATAEGAAAWAERLAPVLRDTVPGP